MTLALRSDPVLQNAYFVAISGHPFHASVNAAFVEYVRKPVDNLTLLAVMKRANQRN